MYKLNITIIFSIIILFSIISQISAFNFDGENFNFFETESVTSGNITNNYYTSNLTGNLTNLSQLSDVDVSGVSDNDVLKWDDAVKKWIDSTFNSILTFGDNYLFFSSDNELSFNETKLNLTIDARAGGLGGNSSWNESMANDLYVNVDGDIMTGDLNISNPTTHTRLTLNANNSNAVALIFNQDDTGVWSIQTPYASDDLAFYSYAMGARPFTLNDDTGKGNFLGDLNVGDDLDVGDNVVINGTTWIYEKLNVSINITAGYFIGDGSYLTGITGGNLSWNESYANTLYTKIGEGMNYSNLALTNETNTFEENQIFNKNITINDCIIYSNGAKECIIDGIITFIGQENG